MDPAVPHRSAVQPVKRRYWRWLVAVMAMALLAGAADVAADRLLERQVKALVREGTHGVYRVSFENMSVSLFTLSVELSGLRLDLDTTAAKALIEQTGRQDLFELRFPKARLELNSIWPSIFEDRVDVEEVLIDHPQVIVYHMERPDRPDNLSLTAGEVYLELARLMNSLRIGKVAIGNAALEYQQVGMSNELRVFRVKDLSFSLEGLSEGDGGTKILFTDRLDILIRDQEVLLADSIHRLHFEELAISTGTSDVIFRGFTMKPRPGRNPGPEDRTVNQYDNHLAELRLSGVDFQRAYDENELHVRKLVLERPVYKGISRTVGARITDDTLRLKPRNSLPELIRTVFNEVHVDTLEVRNGSMDLLFGNDEAYHVDRYDVQLIGVVVDSAVVAQGGAVPRYHAMHIRLDQQRLTIPRMGEWIVDSTVLTTMGRSAAFYGASFQAGSDTKDPDGRMHLDALYLRGGDLPLLLDERAVQVDTILLVGPDLRMRIAAKKERDGTVSSEHPWNSLRPFLKSIHVGWLGIEKGSLDLDSEADGVLRSAHVGSFDLELLGVELSDDAVQRDELLFSKGAVLNFNDVELDLAVEGHRIRAGDIRISTKERSVRIKEIRVDPLVTNTDRQSHRVNMRIPELELTGFDIDAVVHSRRFIAESLRTRSGMIKVEFPAASTNRAEKSTGNQWSQLEDLRIRHVQLNDLDLEVGGKGSASTNVDDLDVRVIGLSADPEALAAGRYELLVDSLGFSAVGFTSIFNLGADKVRAKLIRWGLDDQGAEVRDLEFHPVPGAARKDGAPLIHLSIPEIRSNAAAGQVGSTFAFGNVSIVRPRLQIEMESGTNEQNDGPPKAHAMFRILSDLGPFGSIDTLMARSIHVQEASLNFIRRSADASDTTTVQRLDFVAEDIVLDTIRTTAAGRIFGAKAVAIQVEDIAHHSGNGDHLSVERMGMNSAAATFDLLNAQFAPKRSSGNGLVQVSLGRMRMSGLSVRKLINSRDLLVDSMVLEGPGLHMDAEMSAPLAPTTGNKSMVHGPKVEQGSGSFIPSSIDLRKLGLASFNAGTLLVKNGWYERVKGAGDDDTSMKLRGVDALLTGIQGEGELYATASEPLFASTASVYADSVELPLRGGEYRSTVQGFQLDASKGSVELAKVAVHATVDQQRMLERNGREMDIVDLDNASVNITGLDVHGLLHEGRFHAAVLDLSGADVVLYRDKKLPDDLRIKALPAEALSLSGMPMNIRRSNLSRSSLTYKERSEIGTEPGVIALTNVGGTASNITNDTASMGSVSQLHAHMTGLLQNTAPISVDLRMDLAQRQNERLDVSFAMGPCDLSLFNPFIEPHSFVSIRSGHADTLFMRARASAVEATGTMGFYYNDLHIQQLRVRDGEAKGVGNVLTNLVTNTVVKTNNGPTLRHRTRELYAERDPTKSLVNYMVKMLLNGVKSNAGVAGYKAKVKRAEVE